MNTACEASSHNGLLGVCAASEDQVAAATRLANRLKLPFLPGEPQLKQRDSDQLLLVQADDGPAIFLTGRRSPGAVRVDFASKALAHRRQSGHNELLGRAVGWSAETPPTVLDATAGFGRDAFVLADLGCEVHLFERNPVMATLLDLAAGRAMRSTDARLRQLASRMQVHAGDVRLHSETLLGQDAVNVIYLDPMFPPERKALPGKEMQVLHRLLSVEVDRGTPERVYYQGLAEKLLAWSLDQDVQRVVVKRPRREKPLSGRAPGHSLEGRSIRFDVYPVASN